MKRRPGFTLIELATVVAVIAVLIALLLPAVQSAREAARRTQCNNNLMQLGIALANYEATHRVLPPGVVNLTGPIDNTPVGYHFNWITQILPYIEERSVTNHLNINVSLYDTSNDSARAVTLNVLICPSDYRRGMYAGFGTGAVTVLPESPSCSYAACHNDVESPIDADNHGVFFLNSHVRLDEIEDGLGVTFFVGEKFLVGDQLGWASGTSATLRNTGTPLNRTAWAVMNLAEAANPPDPNGDPPRAGKIPSIVGGFGSYHAQISNFLLRRRLGPRHQVEHQLSGLPVARPSLRYAVDRQRSILIDSLTDKANFPSAVRTDLVERVEPRYFLASVERTRPRMIGSLMRPADSVERDSSVLDDRWMRRAIELAREAASIGEVPVGAVVVRGGCLVSQAYNLKETLNDPSAHAERLALTLAGRALGTWRLDHCSLYVTLEPCPMCAGAITQSRIRSPGLRST